MWKIIVAFLVFAALTLFLIMKGGDKLDMSGEKHGSETGPAPEAPVSAPAAPASGVSPVAPASAAK